ncbi:serine hydrolase domain-containing protein [Nonomuraea glycinis]|uniref:Beta-lactamase-related domain-containing protein n=1 Tax=Nonomuraea glycinis TaxID=2047744 RepID=A0A918E4B9_9ACTN|nr:serine hydrolase domain-containing protein [Nonomuraea glycinis]GGP06457.1 hypothetical protein GCM10012278_30150 [Nonomuraea glycinis]
MAVASASKSFTALAVMQLAEKGNVALDQPVRGYLPELTMADPRAAQITVRQLLHQTSGMADSAFREKSLPQPETLQGAVARLSTARLAADPGTVFSVIWGGTPGVHAREETTAREGPQARAVL